MTPEEYAEAFAAAQAAAFAFKKAEVSEVVKFRLEVCHFGAMVCSCQRWPVRFTVNMQQSQECPVHGQFLLTTEDFLP